MEHDENAKVRAAQVSPAPVPPAHVKRSPLHQVCCQMAHEAKNFGAKTACLQKNFAAGNLRSYIKCCYDVRLRKVPFHVSWIGHRMRHPNSMRSY